jgi:hypothetical protein
MKNEIWKPVVGYEGKYEVSNTGRVRSLNYHRSGITKELAPKVNKYGYHVVLLYKNGQRKDMSVHRLVAMAFIDNPNNFPQINHKNERKDDNHVENLEWCTQLYNANYGTRNTRAMDNRHTGKFRKKVIQLKNGKLVNEYISLAEASRQTGIGYKMISRVACGERARTHGYEWSFV